MNRRFFRLSLILLVAASYTACSDDMPDIPTSGDSIAFAISTSLDWSDASPSSRALDESNEPHHKIYVIEGGCSEMSKPFYLHTKEDDWTNSESAAPSRATQSSEEAGLKSIFMTSYVAQNGGDPQLYFDQEVLSASNNWESAFFWPAVSSNLDFYAYGFTGDESKPGNMTFAANAPAPPIISFSTLNADNKTETDTDLLVGKSAEINASSKPVVGMTMHHALTKIEFEASANFAAGTISAIGFRGVHASGNYDYDSEEWNSTDATPAAEFRRTFPDGIKTDGNTKISLISGDDAFIMLPQALGPDSELFVEFTEATTGLEIELVFPLSGFQWTQGRHIRYSLSTNPNMIDDVFRIVLLPEGTIYYPGNEDVEGQRFRDLFKCNYAGTSKQIRVESFEMAVSGSDKHPVYKPHPVDFTVEGTGCSITLDETVEGHSPQNGFYGYVIEIDHLKGEVNSSTEEHNAWLKRQPAVGVNEAYNLSNPQNPENRVVNVYDATIEDADVGYNTANCYIINAPGKYCFPLIYGNSVKRGRQNGRAFYNATENLRHDEYKVLMHFPNHNGTLIEYPYIDHYLKDNSNVTAEVLWMDKSNLIINPTIKKYFDKNAKREYRFVEFEVPQNSIEQGNAVIAVKENGVIVWSWHIWITDFKLNEEDRTVDDYDFTVSTNRSSYQYMPRNIGWVYCKNMDYYPKEYKVCINRKNLDSSSDRGNINQFFKISQSGGSVNSDGYNVVYQWGRSTPFPGGRRDHEKSSIVDCIASEYSIKFQKLPLLNAVINGTAEDCVSYSIRNPDMFFYSDWLSCWMQTEDDHNGTIILNLWSTYMDYHGWNYIQIYEKQYKSIFDPSPVGYMLPQANSFVPFDYEHMIMEEEKNGMSYYSTGNPMSSGKSHLFFPFSGYRRGSDGKWKMGKVGKENFGQYFTNILYNSQGAYHLCIHSGGEIDNPHHQGSRLIDGMSVRPIRE